MPTSERLNEERDNNWFNVVGRLKPGISLEKARADLVAAAVRLERAYPAENAKMSADVFALRDEYSVKARTMLLALCAASASVLLIACANLASLLVARAFGRRRELELRAALGASRERLVRQLVTESVLLAVAGGGLGIAVALAAVPALTQLIPLSLPTPDTPSIDLPALAMAAALTLITAIGVGVLPALRSSATGDFSALREGVRGGGLRGVRVRSALVLVEVMASLVLLVWAGLLLRALHRVDTTDPGFRTDGVLTLRTALSRPKYNARREATAVLPVGARGDPAAARRARCGIHLVSADDIRRRHLPRRCAGASRRRCTRGASPACGSRRRGSSWRWEYPCAEAAMFARPTPCRSRWWRS